MVVAFFESKFGNINFMEALATSYVAQASKGRTFFEIGTFDGFSAYHLAKNSPSDAVVYTLNLPENSRIKSFRFKFDRDYRDEKWGAGPATITFVYASGVGHGLQILVL